MLDTVRRLGSANETSCYNPERRTNANKNIVERLGVMIPKVDEEMYRFARFECWRFLIV